MNLNVRSIAGTFRRAFCQIVYMFGNMHSCRFFFRAYSYMFVCECLHRSVPRGNFDYLRVLSTLLTLLWTYQVPLGNIQIIPTDASAMLQFRERQRGLQQVTSATTELGNEEFKEYTCFQGSLEYTTFKPHDWFITKVTKND